MREVCGNSSQSGREADLLERMQVPRIFDGQLYRQFRVPVGPEIFEEDG